MKQDWLAEIKKQIHREEDFYIQMDLQLADFFHSDTSESISQFILISPLDERKFEILRDGYFYFEAMLLSIDVVFPVKIAWTEDNGNYMFRWLELPSDEIKEELLSRREILPNMDFSFEIDIKNPVWPHVNLTLDLESGFYPNAIEEKIYSLVDIWNVNDRMGVIHNVGKLTPLGNSVFSIRIDFGSTGLEFLTYLLRGLEEFPIRKLTLDSVIAIW